MNSYSFPNYPGNYKRKKMNRHTEVKPKTQELQINATPFQHHPPIKDMNAMPLI